LTSLEQFAPHWFADVFGYGKTVQGTEYSMVKSIQIPKSYFAHFYFYAGLLNSILLYLILHVYLFGIELPDWMIDGLDFVANKGRARSNVKPEAVVIALTLATVHVWRRMYEVIYVNAPSKATINIFHYVMGFLHYSCVGLGIVSHAPGLLRPHSFHFEGEHQSIKWVHIQLQLSNITFLHVVGATLFIWARKHQAIASQLLARTKRESKTGYGIPYGDWFNLVSCPHYTAECLLYISLAMILGPNHTTGLFICFWVVVNQTILALMSHRWYKQNFPNYSKKAIIPFIL